MTARTKILTRAWVPTFLVRWFGARQCCGERKLQSLSAFASHDMRSPMATVRDAASLLVEGALGELNEKQHRLLIIILERTETWLRLVDEVLVLPQWLAEGTTLHYQEASLCDMALQAIEKTKGLAQLREVTVQMMIPEALPGVMVDQHRLVQALTILLAAVISSTQQGGQARLSASLRSETEVEMKLSGAVMAEAIRREAGMSSVRAIVEAHGGRFCAPLGAADPNTYTFTLPLQVSAASKELPHVESTYH
jgi:signal transduction histidine kinase